MSVMGAPTREQTAGGSEALTGERKVDDFPYSVLLVEGRVSETGIGRFCRINQPGSRLFEFVSAARIF